MYADDTSVIMSGNDLESDGEFGIMLTEHMAKANKLSLNVNKTYYLIFHRARIKVDNDNSIRMNDSIIHSVVIDS